MPPTAGQDAPPMPGMPSSGLSVPLAMLATPDDKENMETPAVGDAGTCTVEYTVDSIDGQNATITPTAINGKPLGEDAAANPQDADMQEESSLRGMALNQ